MQQEAIEDSVETLRAHHHNRDQSPVHHHGDPINQFAASPSLTSSDGRGTFDETTSEWSLSSSGHASPHEADSWLNSGSRINRDLNNDFYDTLYLQQTSKLRNGGINDTATSRHISSHSHSSALMQCPEEILFHIISHLPASDLLTVKLVSRRFHDLVISPHAWMHAFSRFFPGADSLTIFANSPPPLSTIGDVQSTRRVFTRITPSASWNGEYLRRTKLLRCIERGRPALPFASSVPGKPNRGMATCTFSTRVGGEISHLDAEWGSPLDKRKPQFIHGLASRGTVSCSDRKGKIDSWGIIDTGLFRHFTMYHSAQDLWGKGTSNIVGVPNVMALSQPFGMIYAEGLPGGIVYFLADGEKRGRILARLPESNLHHLGIPLLHEDRSTTCALHIATSNNLPKLSSGTLDILAGSSLGIVSAYSMGHSSFRKFRQERGELTARWLLCPGVPIIKIVVDEHVDETRASSGSCFVVVLNALGEVFTLNEMPLVEPLRFDGPEDDLDKHREERAWQAGSSAKWNLVNPSRRRYRLPDLNRLHPESYLPSHLNGVDVKDLSLETAQMAVWLRKSPAEMRADFDGWDMRRRLEVDFGGAGEGIFVLDCNVDESSVASITRYSRDPLPSSHSRSTTWRQSNFQFGQFEGFQISATAMDCSNLATRTYAEDQQLILSRRHQSSSSGYSDLSNHVTGMPGNRARFIAAGTSHGDVFLWDARAPASTLDGLIATVNPVRIIHTASPGISSLALTSLYLVHGGTEGLVQAWDPLASVLEPLRTLSARKAINNRRRFVIAARQNPDVWAHAGASHLAASNIRLDPDPTVLRGIVSIGFHLKYWSYSSTSPSDEEAKPHKRKGNRIGRTGQAAVAASPVPNVRRLGMKGVMEEGLTMHRNDKKLQKIEEREDRRIAGRFGLDLLGDDASDEDMMAYAMLLSQESEERHSSKANSGTISRHASEAEVNAFSDALSDEDFEKWKYASWRERFDLQSSNASSSAAATPLRQASTKTDSELASNPEAADLEKAVELSLARGNSAENARTTATYTEEDRDLAEAIRQSLAFDVTTPATSQASFASPTKQDNMSPMTLSPSRTLAPEEDDLEKAIRLSLQDSVSVTAKPAASLKRRGSSFRVQDDEEFPALGSPLAAASSVGSPRLSSRGSTSQEKGKGRRP